MPDDLDDQIRAAMKTLDDEVPSGYFEALPNQTIARLEGSMQHGSSGTTDTRDTVVSPPPVAPEAEHAAPAKPSVEVHDEDSGLHDIRNLAQSTKQRLARRSTQNPIISDDALASSSGSFKNIALPQPAKMVSLPEIDNLPSKAEVAAAEKAHKQAAKEAAKARKSEKLEAAAPAMAAPAAAIEAPAAPAAAAPARSSFALPSQHKRGKGPLIALVGAGVAAAAGVVIYMQMNKSAEQTAQPVAQAAAPAATAPAAAAPVAEPAPPPAPAPEVTPIEPPPQEVAAAQPVEAPKAEDKAEAKDTKKRAKAGKKDEGDSAKIEVEPAKVETKKPADKKAAASGEEGEPSFDALLKEAGVSEKKEAKPVLEKKSLTTDDFKKGMAPVSAKAKGCYTGTQGTATVKLTVAPSGQISKIAVGGEFAGKPEAACIEAALRAATFPPWDGGPQSFSYAVLLSD